MSELGGSCGLQGAAAAGNKVISIKVYYFSTQWLCTPAVPSEPGCFVDNVNSNQPPCINPLAV